LLILLILLAGCTGSPLQGITRPTVDDIQRDAPETHPEGPLNESEVRRLERIVLNMANHERSQRGIGTLEWSPELARVNDYHAWDMWNRDYFSHIEPDGDSHGARIEQFGYRCPEPSGEVQASSVVLNDDTLRTLARDLVDSWMNSDAHRDGILEQYHRIAGVGIYVDQDDVVYAVMVLCQKVVKRPANVRGTNETVPQPLNETTAGSQS
jgi:uncharacterized protein YkwD